LAKSEDITATLKRVHQLAQTEAMKATLNIEELEQSTRNLTQLDLKYSIFQSALGTSHKLIKHLEQADKWDRTCMLASLGFLGLVLVWIIWRRILKAPVYFFFSVLKFFIFSGKKVTEVVEKVVLSDTPAITHALSATVVEDEALSNVVTDIIETISEIAETTTSLLKEAATRIADNPDL
jgi:protein transport protein SEC20